MTTLILDRHTLANFGKIALTDPKFVEQGAVSLFAQALAEVYASYEAEVISREGLGDGEISPTRAIAVECDRLAATRLVRGCILLCFHISEGLNKTFGKDSKQMGEVLTDVVFSLNDDFVRANFRAMANFASKKLTTPYTVRANITFDESDGYSLN
jgi:hypothetical protein